MSATGDKLIGNMDTIMYGPGQPFPDPGFIDYRTFTTDKIIIGKPADSIIIDEIFSKLITALCSLRSIRNYMKENGYEVDSLHSAIQSLKLSIQTTLEKILEKE